MEGIPFGRYRLIELLGRDGMGEVWKAFDTATNRVVAVKVLPANLSQRSAVRAAVPPGSVRRCRSRQPARSPIHTFGEIDGLTDGLSRNDVTR